MMRFKTPSLLALVLLALLTGCEKKEEESSDPDNDPNPLVPGYIGRYIHENQQGGYLEFFPNDTAHFGNNNNGSYVEGPYEMLSKYQVRVDIGSIGTGNFTAGFDTLYTQSGGNVWVKE